MCSTITSLTHRFKFLEDRRTNVDQSHLSRDKSVAMAKYREVSQLHSTFTAPRLSSPWDSDSAPLDRREGLEAPQEGRQTRLVSQAPTKGSPALANEQCARA